MKKTFTARWLAVVGVFTVAAVAVWVVTRPARQRAKARHDVDVLVFVLDKFAQEQGEYPRGDLATICRLLRGEAVDSQNPRKLDYVEALAYEMNAKGEFLDPWGTPYRILFEPTIRAYSCGPNRIDELGSGDDITAGN